jgi:hypothetical protein
VNGAARGGAWREWLDGNTGRAQRLPLAPRHVDRPERVVEDENPHASRRALAQNAGEYAGHPAGLAVIHLHRDDFLGRTQVVPEARVSTVSVQRHLGTTARLQHGSGQRRNARRELRLAHADRQVGTHTLNVTDHGAARQVEKPNEREQHRDDDRRPERDVNHCSHQPGTLSRHSPHRHSTLGGPRSHQCASEMRARFDMLAQ